MTESNLVRTCNEHDVPLRQLGTRWVCPRGHSCDVDWTLKPLPGSPVPTFQGSSDAAAEAPTPASKPAKAQSKPTQRRSDMPKATVVKPHGTPQRYWQGCRCQPCKTAVNEYIKGKKREQAGFAPPAAKVKAAPPPAPRPVARPKALARRAVEAVVVPADSTEFQSLASEIWSLTKQLRVAEAKYAKAANEFLRNYKVVPVEAAAGQEN